MKRKVQPAASPPKRSTGQATGSARRKAASSRPAHGKRNANATIARAGLRAAASASPTASSRTGRRSGAAGGNPTANRRPAPPTDEEEEEEPRPPCPAVSPEAPDRQVRLATALKPGGTPAAARPPSLPPAGRGSLDRRGGGRERRQAGNLEAQRRGADRGLVVVRLAAERRVDDELDLPRLHPFDRVGAVPR